MDKVFVVGNFIEKGSPPLWTLIGIYTDEDTAVKFAAEHGLFVGPVVLNTPTPATIKGEWPGCYYPQKDGTRK